METLNPWVKEPKLVPESSFQQDGSGDNFLSWNEWSPERWFCNYVAMIAKIMTNLEGPIHILETGLGQGFITRRVLAACEREPASYVVYEDDQKYIDMVPPGIQSRLTFASGSPSEDEFERANLTILDSDIKYRPTEIRKWKANAKQESHMICHDTYHKWPNAQLTVLIKDLKLKGRWLPNPRGGFHAWF